MDNLRRGACYFGGSLDVQVAQYLELDERKLQIVLTPHYPPHRRYGIILLISGRMIAVAKEQQESVVLSYKTE